MTSQLTGTQIHPAAVFAERLEQRLDDLAPMGLTTMTPEEQRQTLVRLTRSRAKEDALYYRLLAQADISGACLQHGAADAGGYVAKETRQTRRDARADLKLAKKLNQMPALAAGMTTGGVNTARARAIVRAVDSLPSSGEFAVSVEQRAQPEVHLVEQAAKHDAVALGILGERIFEVLCPELA